MGCMGTLVNWTSINGIRKKRIIPNILYAVILIVTKWYNIVNRQLYTI